MSIDWFTVIAQVVNFLILVFLLWRFLYKPILHVIDEREKNIAAKLANADKKETEAQKDGDEFKIKNKEFDEQRAALLIKATEEIKIERQRLLDEAQKAADVLFAQRKETLRNDAKNLHQAINSRTQHEVFAITRKILTDLAGASLEEQVVEVFIRRLRELDGQPKEDLGEALLAASELPLLRSAADLSVRQREAIQKALNETFSADIPLRFEMATELDIGIELTTSGQKVSWNTVDYLASLGKGIDELLKDNVKPEGTNE